MELGQHYRATNAIELVIPLAKVLIHPDYRKPKGESDDVALLKLDDPVDFNNLPHVRPMCLPSNRDERFAGLRATVAGWGITTEVDVISDSRCKEI